MTNEELIKLAENWMAAFNSKNLDALLALYHENAQHYSPKLKVRQPETKGLIQYKKNLRVWWQDAFDRLPSLQYELIRLTPFEDRVFMEYTRRVDQEEDLFVGEMLEVKQGLIHFSSVFHR
jgi:ketosteroid isomerase-like protein